MQKLKVILALTVLLSLAVLAAEPSLLMQFFNGATYLGNARNSITLKCSTGMSCTKSGQIFTMTASGSSGVTSVGATVNGGASSGALTISGSPVTTSGTINFAFTGANGDVMTFGASNAPTDSGTLLSSLAPLASPTFTGTPAVPTAAGGTSTTQAASTAFVATSFAPLASPALTGTPTVPTASLATSTTQAASTAFVQAASTPPTNPWYVLGTVVTTNGSVLGVGSNTATVLSMFLDRPLTTTQVSYFIGTTADNTAATYDIGIYTGTPGGTCTLVANVGATAGTTFANAANGMHTFSWAQGSKTLSPGRVYLMFTSSQTGTPASFFQNTPSNLQAYSTAIAVTTGGTAPGTFTCPADGTTQATTQGKWPWEKIF